MNQNIPFNAVHEVMDNFISISMLAVTMDTLATPGFDKSSEVSKEQLMLKVRRELLKDPKKRDVIAPFFLGAVDFLLQQLDLQFAENYQETAHSIATDIFSKYFDINYEEADALITRGFELNCTDEGFTVVKAGGESLLKWLQGDKSASMNLSQLLV